MKDIKLRCPCLFGLESVLSGEVKRLGFDGIEVSDGHVDFLSDEQGIAKANLCLRTAERVQIVLGTFLVHSFTELFDQTEQLPFERYIGKKNAFPVKGWTIDSKIYSMSDCQSIIKKAVAKRLGRIYGVEWLEETESVVQIQFSIHKDIATIMLDTSGPSLHKRGYRQNANTAPIKETLASGILDLARIYPDTQIFDPTCGSGTFLIEAAMKAKNIAPGLRRVFSAQKWNCFNDSIWSNARMEAMDAIRKTGVTFHAWGGDIDSQALDIAAQNAKYADVEKLIEFHKADVKDFVVPDEKCLVVCNPPYGERMSTPEEAKELVKTLGTVFVPKDTVSYHIISSLDDFESYFGRKASKRRKLYNGMMKCQLYSYKLG